MPEPLIYEELEWGHGPRLFEVFLEPTCPFSARALNKLDAFLAQAGEDRVRLRMWIHSQPWHLYSAVVSRAVLAASTLENGKEQAKRLLKTVADRREEFEFTEHAIGPNRKHSPNDILARLRVYSGVDFLPAFDRPELQNLIKRHAKYSRQNGIHASPTFMIDGLIDPSVGSGDEVAGWVAKVS